MERKDVINYLNSVRVRCPKITQDDYLKIIEYCNHKKIKIKNTNYISVGLQSQHGPDLFDRFLNTLVREFKINMKTEDNYLNVPSLLTGGEKGKLIISYY